MRCYVHGGWGRHESQVSASPGRCRTDLPVYLGLDLRELDEVQEAPLQTRYDGVEPCRGKDHLKKNI